MAPRKKPIEKVTEVSIAGVDKSVIEEAAAAQKASSQRKEIALAAIGAVVTIATIIQTVSITWMQSRTREAVVNGTSEVRIQTKAVADRLELNRDEHNTQLESIKRTAEETRVTGDEVKVLVNSGALINARLYVAALKRNIILQTQANGKPDDDEVLELENAQKMLKEHEEGQKVLDGRKERKRDERDRAEQKSVDDQT